MVKLVITPPVDDLKRQWAARLQEALSDDRIVLTENDSEAQKVIGEADAVFGWVPPRLLPLAQKMRWLHSPQIAPPEEFYYQALIEHPVVVTNPRGTFNDHIAQHILMYVLSLARGLPDYLEAQRQRRWAPDARRSRYIDLAESTALIVGVGGIGQETARIFTAAGIRVIGVDARWEYEVPYLEKHYPQELDLLLPQADFVVVTVPHTPETEGMWNLGRFQLMKQSAFFINIGRGLTTKLDDLVSAIEGEQIAGCALDVFEQEPLSRDHRLWNLPNVILTPHVAARDADNIPERQFEILLDNARRFATGRPLRNIVDKSAWY
ncbi:MAG: D-2-hydroxyacid dehydrogenase [Fuerstiella sp.]|nr:D-2-hydroxyacid dehydrogenase [Fuerstiella sp.]